MRLLHTQNLTFREFIGPNPPRYAILSHTWVGDEEVSFQEWENQTTKTRNKSGYNKIRSAASQARSDGFDWVWVDTCCIDKRSSAELTEAINSMYNWYAESSVCYAYLRDVGDDHERWSDFEKSRWFTRGWTLQELIAPSRLIFFAKEWTPFGGKDVHANRISRITGIEVDVLVKQTELKGLSVARRMSWVSKRRTTRVEDIAYCLFGIFDVNLPLLYGEGEKAFRRLQEEILRTHHDHSLFAWTLPSDVKRPETFYTGLLAISPEDFQDCGDVSYSTSPSPKPYSSTNLGLSISLPLLRAKDFESNLFVANLGCYKASRKQNARIFLKRLDKTMYARVDVNKYADPSQEEGGEEISIVVPHDLDKVFRTSSGGKAMVGDASRIHSLSVNVLSSTVANRTLSPVGPSLMKVRPSTLDITDRDLVKWIRFSLKDYKPDVPIGMVRIPAPENVPSPVADLNLLFGYDISNGDKRELWFAEVTLSDSMSWKTVQKDVKNYQLQKFYPSRFRDYQAIRPGSPWTFRGWLRVFEQLYYQLGVRLDLESESVPIRRRSNLEMMRSQGAV